VKFEGILKKLVAKFSVETSRMHFWENNEEIKIFREYLRIPSVHPNIAYGRIGRIQKLQPNLILSSTFP
jgi:hypothetical protein